MDKRQSLTLLLELLWWVVTAVYLLVFDNALNEFMSRDARSVPDALERLALERRRTARGSPPPVALVLPEHVRRMDTPVRPHRLDSYDQLSKGANDDEQAQS